MIQIFLFRTETIDKAYFQTVYSVDIKSAIGKWIRQIEDLQDQVYSFNKKQVLEIKQQYLDEKLKIQSDQEPYFLTYKSDGISQIVNIDRVNKGKTDFIARVTYLTTEAGGRRGYAASGYRPHVKFDGRDYLTTGEQIFVDKDKVFPGDTVIAEIRILSVEYFKNYLFVGQHFEISETSHLVGHGEIIEIINLDLKQSSS